jgi:Undecaprenyl-phosphate galactose phosphotransferase WbaP
MPGQAHLLQRLQTRSAGLYRFKRACKLLLDMILAALLLFAVAPMMLIIYLAIKWSDGGPAFFKQTRIGAGRRPFTCLKFRSMALDSDIVLAEYLRSNPEARVEWQANQKLAADPRVTSLGRFLRRTSLDELPQLLNVLIGDMSLVGPRPITAAELPRYGDHLTYYLSVKPGITGLWQVSGRSDCSYENRVLLDAQYVRDWGLLKDVIILFRTIPIVLSRRGSC